MMLEYILSSADAKRLKHSLKKWISIFVFSTCLALLFVDHDAIERSRVEATVGEPRNMSGTRAGEVNS